MKVKSMIQGSEKNKGKTMDRGGWAMWWNINTSWKGRVFPGIYE